MSPNWMDAHVARAQTQQRMQRMPLEDSVHEWEWMTWIALAAIGMVLIIAAMVW